MWIESGQIFKLVEKSCGERKSMLVCRDRAQNLEQLVSHAPYSNHCNKIANKSQLQQLLCTIKSKNCIKIARKKGLKKRERTNGPQDCKTLIIIIYLFVSFFI